MAQHPWRRHQQRPLLPARQRQTPEDSPDFSLLKVSIDPISNEVTTETAGPGLLQYRPRHYVPIKVALFDEAETRRRQNQQRQAEAAGATHTKIAPVYVWQHRPEMQFSVVELVMKQINRTDADGNVINIDPTTPTVSPSDQSLNLLYDIQTSQYDPLDPFGYNNPNLAANNPQNSFARELVLALGVEEALVYFGQNQAAQFQNSDHINYLNPEDFLTLSLFQNTDSGNILWEYALGILPDPAPFTAEISADRPEIDLVSYLPTDLIVPAGQDLANVMIEWLLIGGGGLLQNNITQSQIGIFPNHLTSSTTAGTTHYLQAKIIDSQDKRFVAQSKLVFGPFIVVPGEPASILMTASQSELLADGVNKSTITATVYDQAGNLVADGTPVQWALGYSGKLINEITTTTNGEASVVYQTGLEAIATDIGVYSGKAQQSISITKRPFTYTLSASATSLVAGSAETVILTVNATEPPSEPIDILWGTTHGRLAKSDTLSTTTATATLYASDVPGDSLVAVSIAGLKRVVEILHTPQEPGGLILAHQTIVGAPAGSTSTVETLSGLPAVYTNLTETQAIVNGIAGTTYTLSAGGFYTPNAIPTAYFAMNGISQDVNASNQAVNSHAYDHMSGLKAVIAGNVVEDSVNSYTQPGSSLALNGGQLNIAANPILDIADDLFVNLRFRTALAGPQTLIRKGTSNGDTYRLEIIQNATGLFVQATVSTSSGTYTVASTTPLNQQQWYITGIRVRNGLLELGVNKERINIAIVGLLTNLGASSATAIGAGFVGNIDEIKIGQETATNALIAFGNGNNSQSVTIGADGTASFNIQSTGIAAKGMQRIGFRATFTNAVGQIEFQEIKIARRLFNRLTGLPAIDQAYAAEVIQEQEDGLAIVGGNEFSQAIEMMKHAGTQLLDFTKTAAMFLYEMSGFADIYTIGLAIYLWMDDRWDDVNKFDLAFAGIGLTLSVVAIITSPTGAGAGAALSLKMAMKGLKATLKELVSDPVWLLKAGGTTIQWSFELVLNFFKGGVGQELAKQQLDDLGKTLVSMLKTGAGKSLALFTTVVRSTRSLKNFIKIRKIAEEVCGIQLANNQYVPAGSIYANVYSRLFFPSVTVIGLDVAHAAKSSLCSQKLMDTINDVVTTIPSGSEILVFNNIAKIVSSLSSAKKLSVNTATIGTIGKLVSKGFGEDILNFVQKVETGDIVQFGSIEFNVAKLNEVAIITNKNTGAIIDESDSVFDVLIKEIDQISTWTTEEAKHMISGLRIQKTNNKANMFWVRGMFGELLSIKSIRAIPEFAGATLRSVNDRAKGARTGKDGKEINYNHQGVDSVWDLQDGRTLYVESKNWAKSSDVAGRLKGMKDQFKKHVREAIGKTHIRQGIDELTGDLIVIWKGTPQKIPRLHYELRGDFFNNVQKTSVDDIYKEFKSLIGKETEPPFEQLRQLLKYGTPDFDIKLNEFLSIEAYPEIIPGLST